MKLNFTHGIGIGFLLASIGFLLFRDAKDGGAPGVPEEPSEISARAETEPEPAVLRPSEPKERETVILESASEEVSEAKVESPPESEDRSQWSDVQWRNFHMENAVTKLQEAGKNNIKRIEASMLLSQLSVATVLDSLGRANENSDVWPKNKPDGMYGFDLNGVAYRFMPGEFPEYEAILESWSYLGIPRPRDQERIPLEEMISGVLSRVGEAQILLDRQR